MNKSENDTGKHKNVLESEVLIGRREKKSERNKRTSPLKILLESDKFKSQETVDKKNHQNHSAALKNYKTGKVGCHEESTKFLLATDKPIKKPAHEDSLQYCKEFLYCGNESREKCRDVPFDRNKSFIEAIIAEKAKRSAEEQVFNSSSQCKREELKLTKSDYRKIHISEILKGHAQKLQSSSSKSYVQVKEKPIQGITELLLKVKNVEKKNSENENKISKIKEPPLSSAEEGLVRDESVEETVGETSQNTKEEHIEELELSNESPKKNDSASDCNTLQMAQEKDVDVDSKKEKKEETRDKKVLKNKWIGCPQSRELERRLQGLWKNNFAYNDSQEADQKLENVENKIVKKAMTFPLAEDKILIKRSPYTDRLALLRNPEKAVSKKEVDGELNEKTLGEINGVSDFVTKIFHTPLIVVKDPAVIPANDSIIKPKTTRSAELRDLVNHAVREHKIFCIFDNHWYIVRPVREELLNRGWLEVIPDRRLIPRRRPPPTGPQLDREKTTPERNSSTIEAILAAKEMFVTELEETVAKCPSLKWPMEKQRLSLLPVSISKKVSELSLKESDSSFRINPPTTEKKKNNVEIREFVAKCQAITSKTTEKEKDKEKEKLSKIQKDKTGDKKAKRSKEGNLNQVKSRKFKSDENKTELSEPTPLNHGLQNILDTVNDHKKSIHKALTENQNRSKVNLDEMDDGGDSEKVKGNEGEAEEDGGGEKNEKENSESMPKVVFKDSEAKTISKIIQATNSKIHFMWLSIKPAIHLKCFNYTPEIVNKFQKTSFCTKIGLWNHLNNIQWYAHEVHFPAKSPRMYNTGEADDLQAFFQDFQLTACIGILKWLADTFFDRGIKAVQTKKGKVPLKAFEFAIKQCERFMRFKDNEDLTLGDEPRVLQEEWNTFLQWFYTITNDHGKLQESSSAQLMVVYTRAVETLRIMKKHWPEMDIDGRLNIWIMKPYCASCGRGIFMTNNVYYIGQHSKYIVQKYIEKPLLIYNTKFDIRQWFMMTKLTPLEIWMYKECYLRFCTQPFALRNLHESVHLSNNSVQRKYVNRHDSSLPDQNMWDSNTFQTYLKTIGHPNAWNEIIYPGMRDAIVSVMLSAQETFDGPRRNWFEVYGADFMLSSNIKDGPWLIEINENPAMDPSTKVTARMCPQMLRDVIKVIVDKRTNKNASTGQWELVYRQNYSPSFATVDLDIKGRKIARAPASMKVEFSHSSATPYEIVKSLTATKLPVENPAPQEPPDPKKLDPLYILKKTHEKYRANCPIKNAKEAIDKIIQEVDGKNLKKSKDGGSCNSSTLIGTQSFSPKKSTFSTDPVQNCYEDLKAVKVPCIGKVETKQPENFDFQSPLKTDKKKKFKEDEKKNESDLFKFTKFYKV